MTNAELIPQNLVQNAEHNAHNFSSFRNPQLARLQRQFVEESKGKGKAVHQSYPSIHEPKEMSIRKINEQFRRLESGPSLQPTCRGSPYRLQDRAGLSLNSTQCLQQSQSGALQAVNVLGQQLSVVVNKEKASSQTNIEGTTQVETGRAPLHPINFSVPVTQELQHVPGRDLGFNNAPGANPFISHDSPPVTVRSSPKRPGDSILGAPPPPAKKQPLSYELQGDEQPDVSTVIATEGIPMLQDGQGSGLLGAPPVGLPLIGQASSLGALGATIAATCFSDVVPTGQPVSEGAAVSLTASLPRPIEAERSQNRQKSSRWDIPPAKGSGDTRSHLHESLRPRPTTYLPKRHHGAHYMSNTHCLRRNRGIPVKDRDFTSSAYMTASPLQFAEETGASYEPWPISTSSPTNSAGTIYSHQAASETHSDSKTVSKGNTLDHTQVQGGDTMEVDRHLDQTINCAMDRAAAHGLNAPRVP